MVEAFREGEPSAYRTFVIGINLKVGIVLLLNSRIPSGMSTFILRSSSFTSTPGRIFIKTLKRPCAHSLE